MKNLLRARTFLKSHTKEVRFVLYFILFFLALQIAHYSVRSYTSPLLVHTLNAQVSSRIINIITPQEKSFSNGNIIGSSGFTIRIAQGCEGTEGILLIVAALCAFPLGIKQKIAGILAGSCIIYVANLIRIVVLYYTLKYKPGIFDLAHVYVGQTFIIVVGVLFFITWITHFAQPDERREQRKP
ncbi:MAG TPA: exosortase/archaeosortase family protein [Syntrophales bacterium]|nr:exosortase/archaeosortase family protein [Syntrophales bacterium]